MPPRGKMMKVFFIFLVPWPQGSTCPCCALLATGLLPQSLWVSWGWHRLPEGCSLLVSTCYLWWGEQEGKWNWWTEIWCSPCVRTVEQASPVDGWPPLGECWNFQNLEVPYFDGKSSGLFSWAHLSCPLFSHLSICCKTEWRLLWLVFTLVPLGRNKPRLSPLLVWPGAWRERFTFSLHDIFKC